MVGGWFCRFLGEEKWTSWLEIQIGEAGESPEPEGTQSPSSSRAVVSRFFSAWHCFTEPT
jgi:hypothetical protein